MSPNRLAITVGFKADGTPVCLFIGEPEGALEAFNSAAEANEFVLLRAFRQLGMHTHPWKQLRNGDFLPGHDHSSQGTALPSAKIPVTEPDPLEVADFEPVISADASENLPEASADEPAAGEPPKAAPKAKAPKAAPKAKK